MYCFEEQNAFYLISAARIHSAYVRSGGAAFDLRLGFIEDIHKWCEGYARRADELDDLLTGNCSWNQRTVGIGVVYVLEIYVERKKCDKINDHKITTLKRKEMKESMKALICHFKLFRKGFAVLLDYHIQGKMDVYLVSRGTSRPYRVHIKASGLLHLTALDRIARQHMLADLVAIIATLNIVFGEVDL